MELLLHSFSATRLPDSFHLTEEEIVEVIVDNAPIGFVAHPELDHIKNLISAYYEQTTRQPDLNHAVYVGIGRTAYILSSRFDTIKKSDDEYDLRNIVANTDFSSVDWHQLIDGGR